MGNFAKNLFTFIGIALLVHAGFSAHHCKLSRQLFLASPHDGQPFFMRTDKALVVSHEMEDVAQIPPIDVSISIFVCNQSLSADSSVFHVQVVIECAIALLVVLLAQVAPLDLVPARVSASNSKLAKSWAEVMSRSDFNTYTHHASKFHTRATKKHLK